MEAEEVKRMKQGMLAVEATGRKEEVMEMSTMIAEKVVSVVERRGGRRWAERRRVS